MAWRGQPRWGWWRGWLCLSLTNFSWLDFIWLYLWLNKFFWLRLCQPLTYICWLNIWLKDILGLTFFLLISPYMISWCLADPGYSIHISQIVSSPVCIFISCIFICLYLLLSVSSFDWTCLLSGEGREDDTCGYGEIEHRIVEDSVPQKSASIENIDLLAIQINW